DDRLLLADRPLDLARHEVRLVARVRQHENEGRGGLDASDDLIAVSRAWLHVARRDPAIDAALLEADSDPVGLLRVGLGVGNEDPTLGHNGLTRGCSPESCRGAPMRLTQLKRGFRARITLCNIRGTRRRSV